MTTIFLKDESACSNARPLQERWLDQFSAEIGLNYRRDRYLILRAAKRLAFDCLFLRDAKIVL